MRSNKVPFVIILYKAISSIPNTPGVRHSTTESPRCISFIFFEQFSVSLCSSG